MRDFPAYLGDILDAMEKIESFIQGMSFEEFVADEKTISAVRDKLSIIGEATKHIPPNVRSTHPEIPWKEMAGMRDILAHAYFRTDLSMLYNTATKRIPEQKALIKKMYRE